MVLNFKMETKKVSTNTVSFHFTNFSKVVMRERSSYIPEASVDVLSPASKEQKPKDFFH